MIAGTTQRVQPVPGCSAASVACCRRPSPAHLGNGRAGFGHTAFRLQGQERCSTVHVRASASDAGSSASSSRMQRLPIFPLSMVALPAAEVPLQIFEARYRVLFSTLMAGSEGIDSGLVSPDKPWAGSRRFGMCFFDPQSNGLASVGTVLEIVHHTCMEDGRLLVQTIGLSRFKISGVVEERPVLVCDVEVMDEDEDTSEAANVLATEVGGLFKEVLRLSGKLRDAPVPAGVSEPQQLSDLGPRELSFWVASLFAGNPYNQQTLLEEDNTMKRLTIEKELLESTLKYLSAQAALQSAFTGKDSEGGSPLPGGPD